MRGEIPSTRQRPRRSAPRAIASQSFQDRRGGLDRLPGALNPKGSQGQASKVSEAPDPRPHTVLAESNFDVSGKIKHL